MPWRMDMHAHTRLHSSCSSISPEDVTGAAVFAGLNGLVITEHHYQWTETELAALRAQSPHDGFILLAGFECASTEGDILVYGLDSRQAALFPPCALTPAEVVTLAARMGGVCVAAHPTRPGLELPESAFSLPFAAIETCSSNLRPEERRRAAHLAANASKPEVANSDAHRIGDIGRHFTLFDAPILSITGLVQALSDGCFRPAPWR